MHKNNENLKLKLYFLGVIRECHRDELVWCEVIIVIRKFRGGSKTVKFYCWFCVKCVDYISGAFWRLKNTKIYNCCHVSYLVTEKRQKYTIAVTLVCLQELWLSPIKVDGKKHWINMRGKKEKHEIKCSWLLFYSCIRKERNMF